MGVTESERVYHISAAAKLLGVHVSSIYRMFYEGKIELRKRGPRKGYRVPESEIKRLKQLNAE